MAENTPIGSRATARILLLSDSDRLLLLQATDSSGNKWWVAPGGGLADGESFEEAAHRELYEETGLSLPIGKWVWTRRHIYMWEGRQHDQYERFYVARSESENINPTSKDSYIIGHRWWNLKEIEESDDEFAPRRLAELLPAILRGEYPDPPVDCGV